MHWNYLKIKEQLIKNMSYIVFIVICDLIVYPNIWIFVRISMHQFKLFHKTKIYLELVFSDVHWISYHLKSRHRSQNISRRETLSRSFLNTQLHSLTDRPLSLTILQFCFILFLFFYFLLSNIIYLVVRCGRAIIIIWRNLCKAREEFIWVVVFRARCVEL